MTEYLRVEITAVMATEYGDAEDPSGITVEGFEALMAALVDTGLCADIEIRAGVESALGCSGYGPEGETRPEIETGGVARRLSGWGGDRN